MPLGRPTETSKYFQSLRTLATTRSTQSALRYGRFYFRPVSGDGRQFSVSPFPQGVLAFSRILNDQEVLMVANTSTSQAADLDVIIEITLSAEGDSFEVLYTNLKAPTAPENVRRAARGSVVVQETDGSTGSGPLNALRVHLRPLEAQILRKKL